MAQLIFFLALLLSGFVMATPSGLPKGSIKVCVYYDKPESSYKFGKLYSIATENLLGHFVEVKAESRVIQSYRKSDINSCDRVIYIGSHYGAKVPTSFYDDVASTSKAVLWFNYKIYEMQKHLKDEKFVARTGFKFKQLIQFTDVASDSNQEPGFFRHFWYKGQKFSKLSLYSKPERKAIAAPEIALVEKVDAEVLSEAEHNKTKEKTPYILRKNNFYFVGDIPYAFLHESDRYLITTDILFDFLNLPPRETTKKALVRIEDVHPEYDLNLLYQTVGFFKNRDLPFAISVIPLAADPYKYLKGKVLQTPMDKKPEFIKALKYAENGGASIILHGYKHQIGNELNCDTGASGDDYEFWDGCNVTPVTVNGKEADRNWVLDRLTKGRALIEKTGFKVAGWVPPHYEASALAYKIFAEFFPVTVQRVRYIPVEVNPYTDKTNWIGQFFPYTIYKDYYGQFIIPENLGNVRVPLLNDIMDNNMRSPEQIVESIRLNSVIRDSWASFFWHPQLIAVHKDGAGIQSIQKIVDEIQAQGYEFVDLKNFEK